MYASQRISVSLRRSHSSRMALMPSTWLCVSDPVNGALRAAAKNAVLFILLLLVMSDAAAHRGGVSLKRSRGVRHVDIGDDGPGDQRSLERVDLCSEVPRRFGGWWIGDRILPIVLAHDLLDERRPGRCRHVDGVGVIG